MRGTNGGALITLVCFIFYIINVYCLYPHCPHYTKTWFGERFFNSTTSPNLPILPCYKLKKSLFSVLVLIIIIKISQFIRNLSAIYVNTYIYNRIIVLIISMKFDGFASYTM